MEKDIPRLLIYTGAGLFSALVSVLTIIYGRQLMDKIMDYENSKMVFTGKSDFQKPFDYDKAMKEKYSKVENYK
jgi:hypothetical protein